jgi:RNA polymerase sigma-70 factor (ECF subfamily)
VLYTSAARPISRRSRHYDSSRPDPLKLIPLRRETTEKVEEPWEPILNEVMRSYGTYLRILADRGLASDLKSKVDASDIVQETFAEVYREYYRFEGLSDDEFKVLLIRMMMNNLKSFTRRYRGSLKREIRREVPLGGYGDETGPGLQVADSGVSPGEAVAAEEDLQRLRTQLARLPERDRLAVTMRSEQGSTYREIGERLGCSSVAARKIWLRTVEKLRRDLKTSQA